MKNFILSKVISLRYKIQTEQLKIFRHIKMSEDNTKFSVIGKMTVIKNMILNEEMNDILLKDLDEMLDVYINKNTKDVVLNEHMLKYLFLGWCISNLAKE